MVCMWYHISTQLCLFERALPVQAEESTVQSLGKSC